MLNNYSSLLNWFRGRLHEDLLIASAPDKYLFLSIAMGITGIVTVLKWDRTLPDSQDYLNLAPLPLRRHDIGCLVLEPFASQEPARGGGDRRGLIVRERPHPGSSGIKPAGWRVTLRAIAKRGCPSSAASDAAGRTATARSRSARRTSGLHR